MRILFSISLILLLNVLHAQEVLEGYLSLNYTNRDGKEVFTDVYMKGDQFYIRQIKNGNPKYSAFVFDASNRKLVTLSQPDKKVAMEYNFDAVSEFYEKNNLKDGYRLAQPTEIKFSDKKKVQDEKELKRGSFSGTDWKGNAWVGEVPYRSVELVKVLHLLGSWNNVCFSGYGIFEMECEQKDGKKKETGKSVFVKQDVPASLFEIPKIYQVVDFDAIMKKFKTDPQVVVLVQSFTEF